MGKSKYLSWDALANRDKKGNSDKGNNELQQHCYQKAEELAEREWPKLLQKAKEEFNINLEKIAKENTVFDEFTKEQFAQQLLFNFIDELIKTEEAEVPNFRPSYLDQIMFTVANETVQYYIRALKNILNSSSVDTDQVLQQKDLEPYIELEKENEKTSLVEACQKLIEYYQESDTYEDQIKADILIYALDRWLNLYGIQGNPYSHLAYWYSPEQDKVIVRGDYTTMENWWDNTHSVKAENYPDAVLVTFNKSQDKTWTDFCRMHGISGTSDRKFRKLRAQALTDLASITKSEYLRQMALKATAAANSNYKKKNSNNIV